MPVTIKIDWDEAAWRLDTELLSPQTRGIYRDILGHLHLHVRSGVITSDRETLARAGRCQADQLDVALIELKRHKVCDITESRDEHGRNNSVTLVNRRMKRESIQRAAARKRMEKSRESCKSGQHGPPETPPANKGVTNGVTKPLQAVPSPNPPYKGSDKEGSDKAYKPLSEGTVPQGSVQNLKRPTREQRDLYIRYEAALGVQWINDAGKWVNRIKANPGKSERVIAEVESAIKEDRVITTNAQMAEDTWKRFA